MLPAICSECVQQPLNQYREADPVLSLLAHYKPCSNIVAIHTSVPNSSTLSHHSDAPLLALRDGPSGSSGEDRSEGIRSWILSTYSCDLLPRKRLYCLAHSLFDAHDHKSLEQGSGTWEYPRQGNAFSWATAVVTEISERSSMP